VTAREQRAVTDAAATGGPLAGVTVLELAGLGPAPFGCMVLADLGAHVLRVVRPSGGGRLLPAEHEVTDRGRATVTLDLRDPGGLARALHLVERADVLVEGFRPGVAERLGIGPDDCAARNPGLVYARMTGWGQTGPLAGRAGHDLTYLAISGALSLMGPADGTPAIPLNLVADYGGGGMLLVVGVLAALLERGRSGHGQVVDAAMLDGVSLLLAQTWSFRNAGLWTDRRSANLLDGGAPFYDVYLCADGGYVALAPLEPKFWTEFLEGIADIADTSTWPDRTDRARWPELRARIAAVFLRRSRDEWAGHFAGTDACVAPVLRLDEAVDHPHLRHRDSHGRWAAGGRHPAPAPRFSRTPATAADAVDHAATAAAALRAFGLDPEATAD
jgi:alpha-methylacyl-CoA racemase